MPRGMVWLHLLSLSLFLPSLTGTSLSNRKKLRAYFLYGQPLHPPFLYGKGILLRVGNYYFLFRSASKPELEFGPKWGNMGVWIFFLFFFSRLDHKERLVF